ncbi:hypothetical protein HB981_12720 [Listeria seeligeri]|uniref:nucleoside 2-deoxyribosyltransferase n=2 Tax=Listeria seeligeri TaxID=1640 RepID=UPI0016234AD2|nr:nucleoside 2-deoxyribosyltransferase [Listeria seeligeri]MBC1431026.1 hypothetical protein [Listeria seeligeri]MBC1727346.1 hypothetical protein [Listeria seeligeri]MBC1734909.1 hypothetical protein [Listeria seeligeri]MBC1833629.1 hypothetical protein [Listeria seeligeri]MBC1869987.1 hypothetical protein [Listeria seeligeri]
MKNIYIGMSLFNYSDKMQSEYLEKQLHSNVGLKTFMPFRDTNEDELEGDNKTKIVYDEDIKRLDSKDLKMMVALYDGICKDEGISLEIGYAFGKGVPIFIINTDFIWYELSKEKYIFDPIIENMCSGYHHYYYINKEKDFFDSLVNSQNKAFSVAGRKIKALIDNVNPIRNIRPIDLDRIDVFIDFGGNKYEYQRELTNWLKKSLSEWGFKVEISQRFFKNNEQLISEKAKNDINNLLNADYFVFLGDEVEVNPGTAALLGLSKSLNKRNIMYESSELEIMGENGHKMKKNLMIDFSVDVITKSKQSTLDYLIRELEVQR